MGQDFFQPQNSRNFIILDSGQSPKTALQPNTKPIQGFVVATYGQTDTDAQTKDKVNGLIL